MSSGGRKLVIHESEKSQKVQMFNWVEDARHEKQLRSLSRSEKTVVGKITVDQKLLYKRYNNRLHHSRITFARITENRQLEKELVNKVNFNTDVGREGEQDVMLQHIWGSGSQKMEQLRRMRNSRRSREYASQFKLRIRSLKEDEDARDEALEEACISRPTTARSLRSLHKAVHRPPRPHTAIGRVKPEVSGGSTDGNTNVLVGHHPQCIANDADKENKHTKPEVKCSEATNDSDSKHTDIKFVIQSETGELASPEIDETKTKNTSLEKCAISSIEKSPTPTNNSNLNVPGMNSNNANIEDRNIEKDNNTNCESTKLCLSVNQTDDQKGESTTEAVNQNEHDKDVKEHVQIDKPELHPSTGQLSPFFSPSSRIGSRSHSRRASVTNRSNQHHHVKIGSLFPEDTKPSLLEIQKVKVKLANYEGRIKKFSERLGDIHLPRNVDNSVDYYNIRLRATTQAEVERKTQTLSKTYKDLLTTTEGEYRRWKGNFEVRSMTSRTVDFDFVNRHSSYIDVSMY